MTRVLRMDMLSDLTDDLLLKILSSLILKDVVATCVLSKRWRSLWKLMPKLKVDGSYSRNLHQENWDLIPKSLAASTPQVLQNLDIKLDDAWDTDGRIDAWVKNGVYCSLRELRIELPYKLMELPTSLYSCGTLETLILSRLNLVDVPPFVSLPSLKTLGLLSVRFSSDDSVQRLLSICPILEDLVVKRSSYVNVKIFTINVPTLRSLSIDYYSAISRPTGVHGFVINAPSLRYLNIKDKFSDFLQFDNMHQLVEANVEVVCDQAESLLGSLVSIQHLSLCSKGSKLQSPCHIDTFFFNLEHLELCTCSAEWWSLLIRTVKHAPRLRVLKLKSISKHCVQYNEPMDRWNEPCYFPECVEILEWRQYEGTKLEEEVAKYILGNAVHLKMATFSSKSTKKHQMFKKLESVPICSKECQLVFD